MINSYYKARDLDKCWKIYYDDIVSNLEIQIDENVVGLMIEIASHSRESEKALSFFNDLDIEGFTQTCLPYNAMIKAFAVRTDYA